MSTTHCQDPSCLFCRIVNKSIPSFTLAETEYSYSFLDINPLSPGHALVIPKQHAVKMHELDDVYLADLLPVAKKVAKALGAENYNILQNNGRLAHQEVMHVHFHIIPKPDAVQGLGIHWKSSSGNMESLKKLAEEIRTKL
eukprot:TRINITY_DN454_c0_g1_i1.p1 TRINITY_DN454_c0_g1~~TRINITY_DN454_c0_g1_i1.p1  ORF type:complete len:141 (+),score=38.09 TRINITY_DN454_c0_g1_i1:73-495(+)